MPGHIEAESQPTANLGCRHSYPIKLSLRGLAFHIRNLGFVPGLFCLGISWLRGCVCKLNGCWPICSHQTCPGNAPIRGLCESSLHKISTSVDFFVEWFLISNGHEPDVIYQVGAARQQLIEPTPRYATHRHTPASSDIFATVKVGHCDLAPPEHWGAFEEIMVSTCVNCA